MPFREDTAKEQLAYANILDIGVKIGFILLVVFFGIYLSNLLPAYVPIQELPKYWGLSVHKYLEATNIKPGWVWLSFLNRSDFLNYISISFLAGLTIICYIRIVPIFFRKRDYLYSILVILQILILMLAASGILKVGGH
ncbi:MAG: hypothetical protein N2Z40_06770 [Caldimicrobium sp.]|nr:hypothetical protein [Caldimicrobium sp.]MCX7613903.1 hypothetical protein [Caldimicrobium sp.]MDW8183453.1 hypothetical protein [Caldimicrobium sp.]